MRSANRCSAPSTSGRTRTSANTLDAILASLQAGDMPCDGAWPKDEVHLFQSWAESGKPESYGCPGRPSSPQCGSRMTSCGIACSGAFLVVLVAAVRSSTTLGHRRACSAWVADASVHGSFAGTRPESWCRGSQRRLWVPGGVPWMFPFRRHEDEVCVVAQVGERCCACLAALGADMVQQQGLRRTGEAVADGRCVSRGRRGRVPSSPA